MIIFNQFLLFRQEQLLTESNIGSKFFQEYELVKNI